MSVHSLLAFGMPGMAEWIIIGAIGLLIFGKRLPEVGRSLGKGIVEFKKGLKGIEEEVSQVDQDIESKPRKSIADQSAEKPAHKYDPYTGEPVESEADASTKSGSSSTTE